MKKIVELKKVSKTYKIGENKFKALDNIDLEINKGEFVVILGPSGAGKSTLLNLIGGMDTPTEGSIKIDGEEISKYTESQLSDYRAENIGFIFQFVHSKNNSNAKSIYNLCNYFFYFFFKSFIC